MEVRLEIARKTPWIHGKRRERSIAYVHRQREVIFSFGHLQVWCNLRFRPGIEMPLR